MNVLLVRPAIPGGIPMPPLSLGYLASALRSLHAVSLWDGLRPPQEPLDVSTGFGAVCIGVTAADVAEVRALCARLKRQDPHVAVVLGGPEVSARGEALLRDLPGADFGFVGEAEEILPLFLRQLETRVSSPAWLAGVPGLVWRAREGWKANPPAPPPDPESLAVAWDLVAPHRYPRQLEAQGRVYRPVAPVITSRGCPDACGFCAGSVVSGSVVRRRSLASVMEEIGLLVERYAVRGIEILDDNFTAERDYVGAFCDAVSGSFPELVWACPNGIRLEALDEPMVRAMRAAGCVGVSVGIDACLARIRTRAGRADAFAFLSDRIRGIARWGIAVDTYALVDPPDEHPGDAVRKEAMIRTLPVRRAVFHPYEPVAAKRCRMP